METLEPSAQRARSRIRSAAVMFYLMAVVKVLALFAAMRPPISGAAAGPPPPHAQALLFAWYAATIVVCSAIGFCLERRMRWSRPAALVVGGLHALGMPLVFFGMLGIMSLITGVLGVMAVGSIAVASALEKIDEPGST